MKGQDSCLMPMMLRFETGIGDRASSTILGCHSITVSRSPFSTMRSIQASSVSSSTEPLPHSSTSTRLNRSP
jgi:hypothetical protein